MADRAPVGPRRMVRMDPMSGGDDKRSPCADSAPPSHVPSVNEARRVWDGPRTKIGRFNDDHWLVQIGWWLEPEQRFVPIMDALHITGSASPVYVEDSE